MTRVMPRPIHHSIRSAFDNARPKGLPSPEVVSRVLREIKESIEDGPRDYADFDPYQIAQEIDEIENGDA
tara:strand:- start:29 stop:238 length:210 start_codon:yes stop_codon:yes gene_type:complete